MICPIRSSALISSVTKARAAAEAAADRAAALADQARELVARARAGGQSAMGPTMRPGEAVAGSGSSAGEPVGPDLLTGKALATLLCAVCHVVASDQPTEPLRQPAAPDFRQIANRPGTTEASLRDILARPHGPSEQMPEQGLVGSQVTVLVGYIMSLRAQHPPH